MQATSPVSGVEPHAAANDFGAFSTEKEAFGAIYKSLFLILFDYWKNIKFLMIANEIIARLFFVLKVWDTTRQPHQLDQ